jgi:2-C-methyl-D-erythritol 4-phosphate cytidylyltransferase
MTRISKPIARECRRGWHEWGGESRAQSVLNGLHALQAHGVSAQDWVLVHDAARCLIQPQSVTTLIETCRQDAVGGILALPVSDTLKNSQEESAEPRIQSTLDRRQKWLAQTPQMFRLGPLEQALAQAQPRQFKGITDEASAMEQMGHHPLLVEGRWDNLKLTYPQDFEFAQHWLNT